jgi:Tripartite tricarboxylate transporter TctB family
MKRNEVITLIFLIIFSVACIISASGGSALILADESLPAHVYSNILAVLLLFVALVRLISLIFFQRTGVIQAATEPIMSRSTLLIAACAVLYTIGITYIGFYVSTFFCMIVLYLGFENWQKSKIRIGMIFSVGLCVLFYVSFSFLKIYLPDGLLF